MWVEGLSTAGAAWFLPSTDPAGRSLAAAHSIHCRAMSPLVDIAAAGGVRHTRGLPAAEVRRLVATGELCRPRRGLVALEPADEAVVLAATLGGVVSCAPAAARQGRRLLHSAPGWHVTVPRDARVDTPAGVVLHRRNVATDGWLTTPSRTVADCLRCLPPEEGLVVADSALEAGIARSDVLRHLRGRGAAQARATLAWADGRSQAVGESVLRRRLQLAGLDVQVQVPIEGVGWVDLLVAGRVVAEVDGFAYHSSKRDLARDRRRDTHLVELGYVVLRFTHRDVVRGPDGVIRLILAVAATV